ncbi:hypothetical protein ACFL1C_11015 [Pseudomonadota bacterium]
MIFRRKKQNVTLGAPPAMRGRDSPENHNNPLARRFHPDDEPDTIDLQQPAGFNEEPGTRDLTSKTATPENISLITLNPETGKFYVQPGAGEPQVLLDGESVQAPTELRRGDRVQIGRYELQLLPAAQDE